MTAWMVTATIEGGLLSSRNAKTMPPPTIAKKRKRAVTLLSLSVDPVTICVNETMMPASAKLACETKAG